MAQNHELALQDYLAKMKYKDIADKYKVSLSTVKSWKTRYGWNRKSMHTKSEKVCIPEEKGRIQKKLGPPIGSQNAKGHGAPKGNRNSVGNRGGYAKPGNKNAERHGFFARIFPDDEETRGIIESIDIKSPLEMLWEGIVIQYTAIARAQRIMFVKNQDDLTKELKRQKESSSENADSWEKEYELQFAWDKHASFLKAQSGAMNTLQNMLTRYEEMLLKDMATEKQQLELDKLKAEIGKLRGENGNDNAITKHNEQILTLRDLLNNPVDDRRAEDFEDDD